MVRIAGHREPRERPEARRHRMRIDLVRAREPNDRLRIADLQQLIGPIAAVNALIVRQTRFAVLLMRNAVRTLHVAGRTVRTVRIDAEQVLAAGRRNRRRIVRPVAALDRPIVVAVIVHRSFAVEQQAVLALLQRQRAVGAEEELVTVLGVTVRLDAMLLRAFGDRGAVGWKEKRNTDGIIRKSVLYVASFSK